MRPRTPESLVLAIDLGSSSVRSALFSQTGARVPETLTNAQYAIRYTAEGAAELDPAVLLRRTRRCVAKTLRARVDSALLTRMPIVAVSGSGFWHGLLGLDHAGRPLTPVFTWADSRSSSDAAKLRDVLEERDVQLRTGCMLRAQFWPAKLQWFRRIDRALFRRVRRWTTPACWIFDQLFGVSSTSHSMASATGLYDGEEQTWDAQLVGLCGLRTEQLDVIADSARCLKMRRHSAGATVFSAIGDGAASNLGSGAESRGTVAINYGTSGAVRLIRENDAHSRRNLPAGLFHYLVDKERAVVGGAVSNAGNLRQWCMRELQLDGSAAEEALARQSAATDSLAVVPFVVEERAPDWPVDLRGTISGLTQTTTAADVLRAATTGTFYRLADILSRLEASRDDLNEVVVSGGILHSPASLKILADCLGRDIRVSRELESSLRGAAIYALTRLGYQPDSLRVGRMVRCNRALALKHRRRRHKQRELEELLSSRSP